MQSVDGFMLTLAATESIECNWSCKYVMQSASVMLKSFYNIATINNIVATGARRSPNGSVCRQTTLLSRSLHMQPGRKVAC